MALSVGAGCAFQAAGVRSARGQSWRGGHRAPTGTRKDGTWQTPRLGQVGEPQEGLGGVSGRGAGLRETHVRTRAAGGPGRPAGEEKVRLSSTPAQALPAYHLKEGLLRSELVPPMGTKRPSPAAPPAWKGRGEAGQAGGEDLHPPTYPSIHSSALCSPQAMGPTPAGQGLVRNSAGAASPSRTPQSGARQPLRPGCWPGGGFGCSAPSSLRDRPTRLPVRRAARPWTGAPGGDCGPVPPWRGHFLGSASAPEPVEVRGLCTPSDRVPSAEDRCLNLRVAVRARLCV